MNTSDTTPDTGHDTAPQPRRTAHGQEGYKSITRRSDPFALIQASTDDIPF